MLLDLSLLFNYYSILCIFHLWASMPEITILYLKSKIFLLFNVRTITYNNLMMCITKPYRPTRFEQSLKYH